MAEGNQVSLAIGYRFDPEDDQLISYYLRSKVLGEALPPFIDLLIFEKDIYLTEPSNIFDDLTRRGFHNYNYDSSQYDTDDENSGEIRYFFTKLKKKSEKTARVSRTAGTGTWKGQSKGKPILDSQGREIGMKKTFSFEESSNKLSTESASKRRKTLCAWIMQEYSLPDTFPNNDRYVLCKIRKKVKEGSTVEELPLTTSTKLPWSTSSYPLSQPSTNLDESSLLSSFPVNISWELSTENQPIQDNQLLTDAPTVLLKDDHMINTTRVQPEYVVEQEAADIGGPGLHCSNNAPAQPSDYYSFGEETAELFEGPGLHYSNNAPAQPSDYYSFGGETVEVFGGPGLHYSNNAPAQPSDCYSFGGETAEVFGDPGLHYSNNAPAQPSDYYSFGGETAEVFGGLGLHYSYNAPAQPSDCYSFGGETADIVLAGPELHYSNNAPSQPSEDSALRIETDEIVFGGLELDNSNNAPTQPSDNSALRIETDEIVFGGPELHYSNNAPAQPSEDSAFWKQVNDIVSRAPDIDYSNNALAQPSDCSAFRKETDNIVVGGPELDYSNNAPAQASDLSAFWKETQDIVW